MSTSRQSYLAHGHGVQGALHLGVGGRELLALALQRRLKELQETVSHNAGRGCATILAQLRHVQHELANQSGKHLASVRVHHLVLWLSLLACNDRFVLVNQLLLVRGMKQRDIILGLVLLAVLQTLSQLVVLLQELSLVQHISTLP